MIRSVIMIAALLAVADASVLVRFINTVPTRKNVESVTSATTANQIDVINTVTTGVVSPFTDKIGLEYLTDGSTSTQLVWTNFVNPTAIAAVTGAAAPFGAAFAMPPLRAYHTIKTTTPEAVAFDKPYGAILAADNGNVAVDTTDIYEQSRLFADGVGLYMVFAAGTYRMRAYASVTTSTDTTGTAATVATANLATSIRSLDTSSTSFTFADNKVYTIIAYGSGQFGATAPTQGNTVRLTMLEESVAPTTFGKAAIRFFNAFGTQTNSMDVYSGSSATATTQIASGIAIGAVSSYIDVDAGTNKQYPIAVAGSTTNFLASGVQVSRDVRAGSRTTVICAYNDETTLTGFCRGIPSRVVAYVRLVADVAAQDAYVQGMAGAQKLSSTKLNLWASYEYPRPEQVQEQSQLIGTQVSTGHPATSEGLYPVVVNVASQAVTGYGEVFVPIYIMDFVSRPVISAAKSYYDATNPLADLDYTTGGAGSKVGYAFAPAYKRVNFVLKTDGLATLTGRQNDGASDILSTNYIFPLVGDTQEGKSPSTGANPFTKVATNAQDLKVNGATTLDRYLEVGEYYTIFATAQSAAIVSVPRQYQGASILRLAFRRDRTYNAISTGIASGKGIFSLVPFGSQTWNAPFSYTLSGSSTPNTVTMATAGLSKTIYADAARTTLDATAGTLGFPATADNENLVVAGTYTYNANGVTTCDNAIPALTGTTTFTIADGQITDLFVLNSYGCKNNQGTAANDVARLVPVLVQRGSAQASGHSPFASASTRAQRHPVAAAL